MVIRCCDQKDKIILCAFRQYVQMTILELGHIVLSARDKRPDAIVDCREPQLPQTEIVEYLP